MSERSKRAIQQDIEATRERIDRTAAELEERVSLDHLGELAMDKLRSSGARDFVDNLGRSVRDHPLPAVLTGIGMRWLMAAETRREPRDDGNGHPGERARELAHDLRDKGRRAASKTRQGAEELTDGLRDGWDRVQQGWNRTVRREPLLLGVLGLAAGVAMATWAPATETEDELLGSTSDRLKRRAATRSRERAEHLRERAGETRASSHARAAPVTGPPGAGRTPSDLPSAEVSQPGPLSGSPIDPGTSGAGPRH